MVNAADQAERRWCDLAWHNPADSRARSRILTTLTQDRSPKARRNVRRNRRTGHGPLLAPLMVFGAVVLFGAAYVTYVLWPRWPDSPVTLDAPTVPIVVSGTVFNIERPAAARRARTRGPLLHVAEPYAA